MPIIGSFSIDDEQIENDYDKDIQNRYEILDEVFPGTAIKYDPDRDEWILPMFFNKDDLIALDNLSGVVDEYAGTNLTYHFGWREEEGDIFDYPNHGHSFDDVLVAVINDPQGFFIPLCFVHEYSEQEIKLLDTFRQKLCDSANVVPQHPIVFDRQYDSY